MFICSVFVQCLLDLLLINILLFILILLKISILLNISVIYIIESY